MASWTAAALVMVLATGCSSREDRDRDAVIGQIRSQVVPALSSSTELGALADLRNLERPNAAVRALFENLSSVPRVIEAEQDRAVLAIWRTAAPEGEPFNANRVATGSACVEITRVSVGLHAHVLECPRPLRDVSLLTSGRTWSRDADAIAETSVAASSLGDEVRWLLFRNDDGTQPRTVRRSARDLDVALDARATSLGSSVRQVSVVTRELSRNGNHVTGTLLITAEVPDPTDAAGTVTATRRYALDADLTIRSSSGHENWNPVRRAS